MMSETTEDRDDWYRDDYHDENEVYCDQDCHALVHPETVEELKAALDHWENHPYVNGCSHGR